MECFHLVARSWNDRLDWIVEMVEREERTGGDLKVGEQKGSRKYNSDIHACFIKISH